MIGCSESANEPSRSMKAGHFLTNLITLICLRFCTTLSVRRECQAKFYWRAYVNNLMNLIFIFIVPSTQRLILMCNTLLGHVTT